MSISISYSSAAGIRDPRIAARNTDPRVCWIQHGGEISWAPQIAAMLRGEGISVRFVSFLREMHEGYSAQGFPSDFIGEIYSGQAIAQADLVELERRYGPPSLRVIAESDVHLKHLFGENEHLKIQVVGRALRFWERYFVEYGISVAIVRDQASVSTRTARQVALQLGSVRMLQIGPGPDNSHFTLFDVDTNWNWSELDRELKKGPQPLDVEREAVIETFVASRVEPQRKRPMRLNLSVPHPIMLPLALWRCRQKEGTVDAISDPVRLATMRLSRELMTKRGLWRALSPFQSFDPAPEPGENFAYFPLFHTEETIHLLNIPFWARHVRELAVALADALPIGYALYLKEHPAILGDVPFRVLRQLRRHPRIRVVAPQVQSQGLIEQAKVVVVLEGSAGWEALLLRRPFVVLAAKPFYSKFPLAFTVENICDLNYVLSRAIAAQSLYCERRAEWLWFIDCVLRTAPPGVLENYEFPHKFPANPENLRLVAAAIGRKIRGLPAAAGPAECEEMAN
jgi:capsular polysaccharide biosynthesis protein